MLSANLAPRQYDGELDMWYIYQSTTVLSARLIPDAYPVPAFCDAATAAPFKGRNSYGDAVRFLAAKVDPTKLDAMPDYERAHYDEAVTSERNNGDFVLNPHKLA